MKISIICRSVLRWTLFAIGFYSLMLAYSETTPGTTFDQWLIAFFALVALSALSFFGFAKLSQQ